MKTHSITGPKVSHFWYCLVALRVIASSLYVSFLPHGFRVCRQHSKLGQTIVLYMDIISCFSLSDISPS